jgi:PAS domain S-box-containing protein
MRIPGFVGSDPQLASITKNLCAIATSTIAVLILGESGTGKELIARAVHEVSGRKGRFVTVDCGALPPTLVEEELFGHEKGSFTGASERHPGLLEEAHGGTVFLDEIAELPVHLQPRLLRVIQEHTLRRIGARQETPIDLRFVSATNADLLERVQEKTFRSDLYFRIAGFTVKIPPLRERPRDIPLLIEHFLQVADGGERRFDERALEFLCNYQWPGNVRELENFVRRMMYLIPEPVVSLDAVYEQLGTETVSPMPQDATLAELEQQAIEQALAASGGNVARAAQRLGLGRSTLYQHLKNHKSKDKRSTGVAEVVLRDRRMIEVSDEACKLLGYKREELLGRMAQNFSDLSQAARDEIYQRWKQRGFLTGLYLFRHKSGARVEVMFEASTLPNGDCHVRWLPVAND